MMLKQHQSPDSLRLQAHAPKGYCVSAAREYAFHCHSGTGDGHDVACKPIQAWVFRLSSIPPLNRIRILRCSRCVEICVQFIYVRLVIRAVIE
ncbi:hypothetical protein B0H12DRAFT_1127042 [Mycena haematopus]|nr:hypothetical protein B0H12DRAFT_1127042 [Mycena haematopus]